MTPTTTPTLRSLTAWETDHLTRIRPICHGSSVALGELAATEQKWRTLPTPPACPPWCTRAAGHGWVDDSPVEGGLGRFHCAQFGDDVFHVSQFEQPHPDGTTTLWAPEVLLDWDTNPRDPLTDPIEVTDIALGGVEAASLLRSIIEHR